MICFQQRRQQRLQTRRICSHNFAGNQRVFVEGIHGAEPVIAVGDDDLAVAGVAHQQNRRERLPGADFVAIFPDVRIADAQQREAGRAENILGLELRGGRGLERGDEPAGRLVGVEEGQVGERRCGGVEEWGGGVGGEEELGGGGRRGVVGFWGGGEREFFQWVFKKIFKGGD